MPGRLPLAVYVCAVALAPLAGWGTAALVLKPAYPEPAPTATSAAAKPVGATPEVAGTPASAPAPAAPEPIQVVRSNLTAEAAEPSSSPEPTSAPEAAHVSAPAVSAKFESAPAVPSLTEVALGEQGTPADAVRRFYQLVEQKQFDRAEALWSPRMRGAFPPAENIDQRFAHTRQLTVESIGLRAVDQARGVASVTVRVVETLEQGATRRYSGTWDLVLARTSGNWLLDQPDLYLD